MTQEEKQLVLADLCARLPYGVKLDFYSKATDQHYVSTLLGIEPDGDNPIIAKVENGAYTLTQDHIKPYLRPIYSMTKKEFLELREYTGLTEQLELEQWGDLLTIINFYLEDVPHYVVIKVYNWLNAHHFDYQQLLEKGLALEAPEGMYDVML